MYVVYLMKDLFGTVKGVAGQEQKVFLGIAEARKAYFQAANVPDKAAAANDLNSALSRLLLLQENYPQLKADENVLKLQEELTTTENQIAYARQAYNDVVLELNTRIQTFPTNLIASNFGFKPAEYFKGAPEEQAVPKVDLSMTAPRA